MRGLLLVVFSALSFCGQAEDLNGIWKGFLTQGPGGCYPRYFLELQINSTGDRVTGKAYDYYDKAHYVKMNFTGRYNIQTHRLVLIENRVLQADIPLDCQPCIKTYDLNYSKSGDQEELTGDWKGVYSEKRLICPPGKIQLTKTLTSDFPVDIDQSDTLLAPAGTLRTRSQKKTFVKNGDVGQLDEDLNCVGQCGI